MAKFSSALKFMPVVAGVVLTIGVVSAWTPLTVKNDPLVRMPGTQPSNIKLESPDRCFNCHSGYDPITEPGSNWQGSMMAQSARDPLFYACLVVAAQDTIHATGNPNATDICVRCHFPKGWLENRSEPTNMSAMTGADFDGVQCDFCHAMIDPFFEDTHAGIREGNDWVGYWDETNASSTPSQPAANTARQRDITVAQGFTFFNGTKYYGPDNKPKPTNYRESTSGQFYVDPGGAKRGPFSDNTGRHQVYYSRFNKSKYFCGTCHDVSNPVLANLSHMGLVPGDGTTVLPSEANSAYSYFHVERTFSEFMLSDYGQQGGAAGTGPFRPEVFITSQPGNKIATCQDCHMRDVPGKGCDKNDAPFRPGTVEHPRSGVPSHDLTGGNIWIPYILASTVNGSSNYNAVNANLLKQGPNVLTLNLTQGMGLNANNLLRGVDRAKANLESAASIEAATYTAQTGQLSFRVRNHTGHKLISGFPEGRRMFVNVKLIKNNAVIYEVNPYDLSVGTLKGLSTSYSPNSPALAQWEAYVDELVYECHPNSTITGEMDKTFHFALATGRAKDNRIPPRGFRIQDAIERLSEPVWDGQSRPDYFSTEEYAGGYDSVVMNLPGGADRAEIKLYYQVTSREYIEFLRDQINGTGKLTLPASAYIAQTDPWFSRLKAWGNTIWQLWLNNKDVPGAAPYLMAQASVTPSLPVSQIKAAADGSAVWASGALVTAVFDGFFYIQSDDRASGIQVVKPGHLVTEGMRVDVSGTVRTSADKERYVDASTVIPIGTGSTQPIHTSHANLGGSNWMLDEVTGAGQAGVTGGVGLNNIGLLVSVWGRVTSTGTGQFWLWDGSGLPAPGGITGIRIQPVSSWIPTVGSFAGVKGISSLYLDGGMLYRQVLPVEVFSLD